MTAAPVFLTGGAGFIGTRLALALAARGHKVMVYDSFLPQAHAGLPNSRARLEAAGITVVKADIRDQASLERALAAHRPAVVYHLAAETGTGQSHDLPARYAEVNVTGTARLVEALRRHAPQVRRVILAGSRAVYGEGACIAADGRPALARPRRIEDMQRGDFAPRDAAGQVLSPVPTRAATCPPAPASVYASTKLMQEYLLAQGLADSPARVGILRLQNVYGPGQSTRNPYTGVLSIFARQILDGQVLEIYEDGQITRDFVLVDDVVEAFVRMGRAAEMPEDILDIGSGQGITILDTARRLLALLGAGPDRLRISGRFRPGDIRHAVADISAARRLLGWEPAHDIEDGLTRLAAWVRAPDPAP